MNVLISIILFFSPHYFSYEEICFKIFGKGTKVFLNKKIKQEKKRSDLHFSAGRF